MIIAPSAEAKDLERTHESAKWVFFTRRLSRFLLPAQLNHIIGK
jgi:hypothetical protein